MIKPTSVRIPLELLEILRHDAKMNKRSLSQQIIYIIDNYYSMIEESK